MKYASVSSLHLPISPYISLGDPVEVRLRELALSVAAEATLHGERARDLVRVRIRVRSRVRLRVRLRLRLRLRVRVRVVLG